MKKQKQKIKKIVVTIIAFTLIIGASAMLYASSTITNPTFISFEDGNLFKAIQSCFRSQRIDFNVTNNETKTLEVSIDDLSKITQLDLSTNDFKIANISGLENFPNVMQLDLSGNEIQSLEPIVDVLPLTNLNLSGNSLTEEMKSQIASFENLTQLNLSNTNISAVDFLNSLINLENLTLSKNVMSTLVPIGRLTNITKLDVSQCTSFSEFRELTSLYKLKELNVSGTSIYYLDGIENLGNLEKLYAENINRFTEISTIASIYATYEKEIEVDGKTEEVDVPYLEKLKVLNLSNMGITNNKPSINLKKFNVLKTLEELHLKSNEISSLTDVAQLENLDYLDLADNEIESDDLVELLQYETVEDVETGKKYKRLKTENTLKATKIDLSKNEIIDLDVFASYPAYIKWLNLSENHIYKINPLSKHKSSLEMLNLQKQNITFGIYEKKVETDHYIILPEILKWSKIEGSLVYAENSKLTYNGVTLNPEYTDPEEYNVIIDSGKTKDDTLSVTLTGGTASGTVLNFKIGSKTNAHVDCLIESLVFMDENLDAAIYNQLMNLYTMKEIKYLERVPFIININQAIIKNVKQFNLAHTGTNLETKIKDLTGIENFLNLEALFLQFNDLINIASLSGCTKLQTLYLSNNPNIGDNNSSIEKLSKLMDLDLSNTGMTNINTINNLIYNNYTSKKKTPILAILKLSGNKLNSIEGLESITSLETLHLQNTGVDAQDIAILKTLKNLVTLNLSENQIENIDVISNLTNLQYLYLNKNKIKSLDPIEGMTFYNLKFSDNKVKDISPLYAHQSIDDLEMNNNKIEDVTVLSNILITEGQKLSATNQRITRILEKSDIVDVSIALPQIFKAARENGNKLFTSNNLSCTNCELDSTGENVIINRESLGNKIAQVSINGGKANGTTLSIAAPLEGTITYNPSNENPTNQNVTASITFNRSNVKITNNDGNNTYTFTENGEFSFEFIDEYGFEGSATAVVENIDKVQPQGIVTQTVKDGKVIVTIQVNEEIAEISGWEKTINNDGKIILTKVYDADSAENVKLVDLAGNETNVKVEVKIDKTAPKITGVTDGEKYSTSVTPQVEDQSEVKINLTKDDSVVSNYKIGTPITDAGLYVLTVTDAFGNTTTVSFEIEISDIITSDEVTIAEQELVIKNIDPKTTVSGLKYLLKSQMDFTIIDKNGNTVSESANVGTGYQIKMPTNKIYTLIVRGDCNGDGDATITDIFSINSHRLKVKSLSGIYLQAADVNDDSKADIKDIFKINSYRLQGGEL